MSSPTPHCDVQTLLRLVDDDLPRAESGEVTAHLNRCNLCQGELDGLREALDEYLQFHSLLKAALPPPPQPWSRLELRSSTPQPRTRLFAFGPRRWLLAAAAVVAVFLAVRRFEHTPAVKAAELLRKATTAEKTVPPRAHPIRIRSRKYKWDRPAHLAEGKGGTSPEAAVIRHLLDSAGYSWENPLSAGAYARWHDRLSAKQDRVEGAPQAYVIHTTTTANPISDASLTLGSDLHAVACTLRFGGADILEMTELPDEESARPLHPPAQTAQQAPAADSVVPPPLPATPGEELQVLAALHRIGADLGEPIDVRREGPNVLVSVTGLGPGRQVQVKAALGRLAAVRLQFGEFAHSQSTEATRRPPPQVATVNPLLDELQAASPGAVSTAQLADRLTDATDKIIERVYAIRGLVRRFPGALTGQMAASEVDMFKGMLRDHAVAVAASTSGIKSLLAPVLSETPAATPAAQDTLRNLAESLLADARSLDQALNGAGTADDAGAQKLRAAQALSDIDQRMVRLDSLIQP